MKRVLAAALLIPLAAPGLARAEPPPLPEAFEVVVLGDALLLSGSLNEAGQVGGAFSGLGGTGLGFYDGEALQLYRVAAPLTGELPAVAGFNTLGQLVVNLEGGPLAASLRLDPDGGADPIYRPGRNGITGRIFEATGVDDAGHVIGRMTDDDLKPTPNDYKAFWWEGAVPQELSTYNIDGDDAVTWATHVAPGGRYVLGEHVNGPASAGILLWDVETWASPVVVEGSDRAYGVSDEGAVVFRDRATEAEIYRPLTGPSVVIPPLQAGARTCDGAGPLGSIVGPQGWLLSSCRSPALRTPGGEGIFLEDVVLNPPEGLTLEGVSDLNGRGQILATFAAYHPDGSLAALQVVRLDPVDLEPVTGACRLPAGACMLLTQGACEHWSGAFSGVGASCL